MPLQPKDAGDDALRRARAVLAHGRDPGLASELAADLVRSALTMGVAALDAYMHAAVINRVDAWQPSAELAKLDIRFDELCEVVAQAVEDRRANASSRPWVAVKVALQERLLRVTFQAPRDVENGMRMCGVNKPWTKLSTELGHPVETLKQRLGAIVHRRNRIVHEADQERMSRPRSVRLEEVDATQVAADLDWLDRLVAGIETVLNA